MSFTIDNGNKNKNSDKILSDILERAKDLILNSKHYSGRVETIEFIKDKMTNEQFNGYLMGNIFKYLSRYNRKGKEYLDLNKAFIYLVWLLQENINNEQDISEKNNF